MVLSLVIQRKGAFLGKRRMADGSKVELMLKEESDNGSIQVMFGWLYVHIYTRARKNRCVDACLLRLPTYLSIYLPTYLSIYLPSYLPTYLPVYLSTYLPTHLSEITRKHCLLWRDGHASKYSR